MDFENEEVVDGEELEPTYNDDADDTSDTHDNYDDANVGVEENETQKYFTQEQLNNVVRDRLNKVYSRYEVNNAQELDDLVSKAYEREVYEEEYNNLLNNYTKINRELTFLKNNINFDREDDIVAYFKGKDIDFTADNLIEALKTHPEWLNAKSASETQKTTIQALGNDANHKDVSLSELEQAEKLFGVKFTRR